MGFFNNFGRVTTAATETIVTSAETVTTVANAGKMSAEVLVIKAQGLKEDAVLEAASDRLNKLKTYSELKTKIGADDMAALDAEFDAMMKSYSK